MENYFINKYNKKMHEISFYYLMKCNDDLNTDNFSLIENDKGHEIKLNFYWIDLKQINDFDVRPEILTTILKGKNMKFEHLIFNEL